MKILVISGFLGAGKTTFIKAMAQRTGRDFAVMENEYGQVGIDGPLLAQDEGQINIWELTEGCICCSTKSDFASSILTIANTLDPEYLIVEPTGVGYLSKVMNNIRQIQYERITLLEPITILDGQCFEQYLTKFSDLYRDQIASAGTILISKLESAGSAQLQELEQKVRALNPTAQILARHYSHQPPEWWQGLLTQGQQAKPQPDAFPEGPGAAGLENLGLTSVEIASGNELVLFLQGVVSGVFGDICRAKGYLPAGKAWLRFDVVDKTYTITGIEPMADSRAVFIGREIKRSWLRQVLQRRLQVTPGRARFSQKPKPR